MNTMHHCSITDYHANGNFDSIETSTLLYITTTIHTSNTTILVIIHNDDHISIYTTDLYLHATNKKINEHLLASTQNTEQYTTQ